MIATLILPVSSLTMTAIASESCDIPIAARWRRPRSLGISRLCDTGRIHPADFMRFLEIIIAPSCKGEFLKNMFSIRRWLIRASIRSPVFTISSSGIALSITIRAPTLFFDISIHANTIGIMVSLSSSISSPLLFANSLKILRIRWWVPRE